MRFECFSSYVEDQNSDEVTQLAANISKATPTFRLFDIDVSHYGQLRQSFANNHQAAMCLPRR
jgi:hypothetical protein